MEKSIMKEMSQKQTDKESSKIVILTKKTVPTKIKFCVTRKRKWTSIFELNLLQLPAPSAILLKAVGPVNFSSYAVSNGHFGKKTNRTEQCYGSVRSWYGSGSKCCFFRQRPSRQQKILFFSSMFLLINRTF